MLHCQHCHLCFLADLNPRHDQRLNRASSEPILQKDVYTTCSCASYDNELVSHVRSERVYDAILGCAVAGVCVFTKKGQDDPGVVSNCFDRCSF